VDVAEVARLRSSEPAADREARAPAGGGRPGPPGGGGRRPGPAHPGDHQPVEHAAKYTEDGGRIWLAVEAANGDVVARVKDTGVGIPPEHAGRGVRPVHPGGPVARPVRRRAGGRAGPWSSGWSSCTAGRSRRRARGGEGERVRSSGLPGLAAGQGAADPHQPVPAGGPGRPADDPCSPTTTWTGPRAWPPCCGSAGTRSGWPTTAGPPWELAAATQPDVVFLDIGLPVVDGYEVARRLRAGAATRSAALWR